MKFTLAQDLIHKSLGQSQFKINIPKAEQYIPLTLPQCFYKPNFLNFNRANIKLLQYKEEKMVYHFLNPHSMLDDTCESDMLYAYQNNMKINRDLNQMMVEAYFGLKKPIIGVVGNQAIARFIRYVQDLGLNGSVCDSKRNFSYIANYMLEINNLSNYEVHTAEKYEYLSSLSCDLIDVETDFRKPFQLLVPALRAVKDGGLLIYTIVQFIPNQKYLQKLTKKWLNLFGGEIYCNSETVISGTLQKINEIAYDLGKHVEFQYFYPTGNDTGHLTVCMSVHEGIKEPQDSKYQLFCKTCKQYCSGCDKTDFCNLQPAGPVVKQLINYINKDLIIKCQDIKRYNNYEFINEFISQSLLIPNDVYPFYINNYLQLENSYDFYNHLGNQEGYFVQKSPFHNMPTVYTNMPFEIIMGKVHQYMIINQIAPNEFVASFKPQELEFNNIKNPLTIQYQIMNKLYALPRNLKQKRQQEYGWIQQE